MERSVIWVTQVLTRQLGMARVTDGWFAYGNQDFSGGLDQAWRAQLPLIASSSMSDLWREKLPVSPEAQRLTKQILVVQTSDRPASGKTAAAPGRRPPGPLRREFSNVPEGEYVVVPDFQGACQGPGGPTARQLAMDSLDVKNVVGCQKMSCPERFFTVSCSRRLCFR